MTFEQLYIFVAVAEREHLTQGAAAIGLTPSAVSASIKALENFYRVTLFDRVGRGIKLTREGRVLLREAKETLAKVKATEAVLNELGNLSTGVLDIQASQTISNHWLPSRLLAFARTYPGIQVNLQIGNTTTVADGVTDGDADLGFIEGTIDRPALFTVTVATDKLVIVAAGGSPGKCKASELREICWVMRERGSGTRDMLERGLRDMDIDPESLKVSLTLPSNEALLAAVRGGNCITALSESIVAPFLENGQLRRLDFDLPPREFTLLRHKERHLTAAAKEFEAFLRSGAASEVVA